MAARAADARPAGPVASVRVAFIGPMSGRPGGTAPSPADAVAESLSARGHACRLCSAAENRLLRPLDMAFSLLRWRAWTDVACIQVFSGPSFLVADLVSGLAQRLGHRQIMVLHGGGLPDLFRRRPRWSARVLSRAQVLVAPSRYLALAAQGLGLEARIIPNMIDLQTLPWRARDPAAPRLLWLRAFHEIYRPELAVRTLAELRREAPEATLTMAGRDKGALARTCALAGSLGLAGAVRFPGFLDEAGKRRALEEHDVLLTTSRVDNAPVSVVEAAAAGAVNVAVDVGGLGFLIEHEKSGLLVDAPEPGRLAAAVLRLSREPGLALRLSSGARRLAEASDRARVLPLWDQAVRDAAGAG